VWTDSGELRRWPDFLDPGFLIPGWSVLMRPTMLTRMTDEDWESVVQVFRAVRSRRGAKGRDDRRFLEALHYFCVHNITWRALPAEFGNWNSVWMVDSQTTNSALFAMVS
jgi:Putative transposase of IS4/5 family (DUF4096)